MSIDIFYESFRLDNLEQVLNQSTIDKKMIEQ